MDSGIGRAFDAAAPHYDRTWGTNPVGLLFRHAVQERLAALFAKGTSVLDLGCGTGEDALFLAARGVRVTGIDASPRMIDTARMKAAARGLRETIRFEQGDVEEMDGFVPEWHGAYSNFGALNCVDLARVGRRLAELLMPGAPVLFTFMGRWPLPATLERALTGRGQVRRDGDVAVAGTPVSVRYPTVEAIRRGLGQVFAWRRTSGLGVVLPDPGHRRFAVQHPQALAVLAVAERLMASTPGLRALGDHVVLEGHRR
jgi:SAM-dependent methyltransferase